MAQRMDVFVVIALGLLAGCTESEQIVGDETPRAGSGPSGGSAQTGGAHAGSSAIKGGFAGASVGTGGFSSLGGAGLLGGRGGSLTSGGASPAGGSPSGGTPSAGSPPTKGGASGSGGTQIEPIGGSAGVPGRGGEAGMPKGGSAGVPGRGGEAGMPKGGSAGVPGRGGEAGMPKGGSAGVPGRGGAAGSSTGGAATGGLAAGGAGGQPADWFSCARSDDCYVRPASCCGNCGAYSSSDVIALNQAYAQQYFEAQCAGTSCLACAASELPSITAVCDAGRCQVVDLTNDPMTACTQDSECRIHTQDCCECGGDTSQLVSVSQIVSYLNLVCPAGTGCAACVPSYGTAVGRCNNQRCVVGLGG